MYCSSTDTSKSSMFLVVVVALVVVFVVVVVCLVSCFCFSSFFSFIFFYFIRYLWLITFLPIILDDTTLLRWLLHDSRTFIYSHQCNERTYSNKHIQMSCRQHHLSAHRYLFSEC